MAMSSSIFKKLKSSIFHLLFPTRCMICSCLIEKDEFSCEKCAGLLQNAVGTVVDEPCDGCSKLVYGLDYDIASNAVYKVKNNFEATAVDGLVHFLEIVLKNNVNVSTIDIVVAAPMHKKDINKVGKNHASVLAKKLSNEIGLAFRDDVLVKIKRTHKQHRIDYKARMTNLDGAFAVANKDAIKGKKVLIVDDVYTTGTTVMTCSKVLLQAGASEIISACTAKTGKPKTNEGE